MASRPVLGAAVDAEIHAESSATVEAGAPECRRCGEPVVLDVRPPAEKAHRSPAKVAVRLNGQRTGLGLSLATGTE